MSAKQNVEHQSLTWKPRAGGRFSCNQEASVKLKKGRGGGASKNYGRASFKALRKIEHKKAETEKGQFLLFISLCNFISYVLTYLK